MGKVYKRLTLGIAHEKGIDVIDSLFEAYNSFVSDKTDDYNSSFYYDVPQNILNAFLDGKMEYHYSLSRSLSTMLFFRRFL